MVVHSVILLPGDKMRYFCKDGLSPLDVMNVGQILNFGGSIEAVDCGAQNEYVTLEQAEDDMANLYRMAPDGSAKVDFKAAREENRAKLYAF